MRQDRIREQVVFGLLLAVVVVVTAVVVVVVVVVVAALATVGTMSALLVSESKVRRAVVTASSNCAFVRTGAGTASTK